MKKEKFQIAWKHASGKHGNQPAENRTDLMRCIREMLNDNMESIHITTNNQ